VVTGVDWSYFSNLVENITDWKSSQSSGHKMCDGGAFTEQLELINTDKKILNSTVYAIDNDSCSGNRSIPENETTISIMSSIKTEIINLVKSNSLTDSNSIQTADYLNIQSFITCFGLLLLVKKSRKTKS
jgi:hypothetical protein